MTQTKANRATLPLSVRLCTDKSAFEALVSCKVIFNMHDAKRRLEKANDCQIIVYTPHLLVFRCGEAESTLSRDGRMLIKRVKDENEAELVARKVWQTILKAQY